MCGIIGKVGKTNVAPTLINGLKRLEYRGYDSSGIALSDGNSICDYKAVGRIKMLEEKLEDKDVYGTCGIAHTRWATHGTVTEENAHPHMSPHKIFAVVHNGIIENFEEIKKKLLIGDDFTSQTDTEVFAHLLEKYYKGDPISAIANACAVLKGSYAFGILCRDFPHKIYASAAGSSLVAGRCSDGVCIASDTSASDGFQDGVYRIKNGEILEADTNSVTFYDASGKAIEKRRELAETRSESYNMDGYSHYMLKEIMEQPKAVEDTVNSFVAGDGISFPHVSLSEDYIKDNLDRIVIVACGSAYHTGLVGKRIIESLCKVPCSVEIASEFRYSEPLVDEKTLAIFVSQSGETADTLASLRLARRYKAQILSIVNVKGSVIAEESDNVIFTRAGKEVAVATTKAYSCQLVSFYALGIYIASLRRTVTTEKSMRLVKELKWLPQKISQTLSETNDMTKSLSEELLNAKDIFYIGRLSDYATACEGSLKMKEISYINSQSYPAGELKHGTISLIEKGTPVIAVLGEEGVFLKTLSNVSEVVSRGARAICIHCGGGKNFFADADYVINVADTVAEFRSSLLVIPLQLLSYYTAFGRGCDIDKPRNLAKSVTVE